MGKAVLQPVKALGGAGGRRGSSREDREGTSVVGWGEKTAGSGSSLWNTAGDPRSGHWVRQHTAGAQ